MNETDEEVKYQVGDETLALPASSIRTHEDCRSAELKFDWTEAEGKPETFKPGAGDRFVITKKEASSAFARKSAVDDAPAKQEAQAKPDQSLDVRPRGLIRVIFLELCPATTSSLR